MLRGRFMEMEIEVYEQQVVRGDIISVARSPSHSRSRSSVLYLRIRPVETRMCPRKRLKISRVSNNERRLRETFLTREVARLCFR